MFKPLLYFQTRFTLQSGESHLMTLRKRKSFPQNNSNNLIISDLDIKWSLSFTIKLHVGLKVWKETQLCSEFPVLAHHRFSLPLPCCNSIFFVRLCVLVLHLGLKQRQTLNTSVRTGVVNYTCSSMHVLCLGTNHTYIMESMRVAIH